MPLLDTQDLVPGLPSLVDVQRLSVDTSDIPRFVLNDADIPVAFGVSLRLTEKGAIDTIVLATPTRVFQIRLTGYPAGAPALVILASILPHQSTFLAGFHFQRLALVLHNHFQVHVRGVDLSTLHSISTFAQLSPAQVASKVFECKVRWDRIHRLWDRNDDDSLCLRAWLSACIADKSSEVISSTEEVDTRNLYPYQLRYLSYLVVNIELVEATRPRVVDGEVVATSERGEDGLGLVNARFKSRVRPSSTTVIEINGDVKARATASSGKRTELYMYKGNLKGSVESVKVVGREEPTNAELSRDEHLLLMLQGEVEMDKSLFVRILWFPKGVKSTSKKSKRAAAEAPSDSVPSFDSLNESQRKAAIAMVGNTEPFVLTRGPPGTGKTSTIAAVLAHWQSERKGAWVVAHSNVGVKNIAETLRKRGVDFKLIVSHEFYFEWHEHHYVELGDQMVQTSDIFQDTTSIEDVLGKSKIILCTLGMLSNPGLAEYGVFKHCPVERLIVDEASQIDTLDFMHLFHKFKRLQKVCMFGDSKQLPPHGRDAAPKMKTVFNHAHLMDAAYFLDTQYRMPVPLGEFISKNVYRGRLKSDHPNMDPACVAFIDVPKGREERVGTSWRNIEEAHTVVNIAREYHKRGKHYCIITPYDPQRAALATALENADLPNDNVYNVDSFQGHEADYVIISAVRTSSPGFLSLQNRVNVMLTRCREGMVIVSQRAFVHGRGAPTLLGQLAEHWTSQPSEGEGERPLGAWVDAVDVLNGRAGLPGCDS